MLPILRILPVGGVFFAIMILVLSLGAPGSSRSGMGRGMLMSARGPLMQIDEHPEWRQFLIHAALQRADEIARLRDLPNDPVRETPPEEAKPEEAKVAGLPAERNDTDPEDITGTISDAPAATLPIEIGETSSTELPAMTPEDKPPMVKIPGRVKPQNAIKRKTVHRLRRPKAAAKLQPPPPPFNIFEAIFGSPTTKPAVSAATQTARPQANRPQANQQTAGRVDTSQR